MAGDGESYGYDTYTPPPVQPKPKRPEDRLRDFGKDMVDWYDKRQTRTDEYFKPAQDDLQTMRENRPSQVNDLYTRMGQNPRQSRVQNVQNNSTRSRNVKNQSLTQNVSNNTGTRYTYRAQNNGPSDVNNRFSNRQSQQFQPTQGQLGQAGVKSFAGGPTVTSGRYTQRQGQGRDVLEDHFAQRQKDPRILDTVRDSIDADSAFSKLGPSAAGDMMFDPTQTVAMGDRYDELHSEEDTPGYLEDFFTKYQNGDNPYSVRARERTAKDAQRRAAAGGNFNAGIGMRRESDALAQLEADEFEKLGAMAGQAQGLKQERSRDVTGAGKMFEDSVLGNRNFNLGAASQVDDFGLKKAGGTDAYGLGKGKLFADTGIAETGLLDKLAGDTSSAKARTQEAIDKLAVDDETARYNRQKYGSDYDLSLDDNQLARDTQLDTLSKYSSDDKRQRDVDIDHLANDSDVTSERNARLGLDTAKGVTDEEQGNDAADLKRAEAMDKFDQDYDNLLKDLATGASKEQMDGLEGVVRQAISLATQRAQSTGEYDRQAGETLTETEVASIDAELQRLGMDDKKRSKVLKFLMTAGGAIVGGIAAGAVTGGMGAGQGAVMGAGLGSTVGEAL